MSKPTWKSKKIVRYTLFTNSPRGNLTPSIILGRNDIISQKIVQKNVLVYTDKGLKTVRLTNDHIGYKLGEFIFTRKPYIYKGKKKAAKKNK